MPRQKPVFAGKMWKIVATSGPPQGAKYNHTIGFKVHAGRTWTYDLEGQFKSQCKKLDKAGVPYEVWIADCRWSKLDPKTWAEP